MQKHGIETLTCAVKTDSSSASMAGGARPRVGARWRCPWQVGADLNGGGSSTLAMVGGA
jgi:hypothetical protein